MQTTQNVSFHKSPHYSQ